MVTTPPIETDGRDSGRSRYSTKCVAAVMHRALVVVWVFLLVTGAVRLSLIAAGVLPATVWWQEMEMDWALPGLMLWLELRRVG